MTHSRSTLLVRSTFVCLLSLGLGATSCTSVLGIEDTTLDTGASGATGQPQWSCLDQTLPAQTELTVVVPVVLLFSAGGQVAPVTDIQIDICEGALDVACNSKIAEPQFTVIPSQDGTQPAAVLKIPRPKFDGFLRFTDSNKLDEKDRTLEFRYYFSPTLQQSVTLPAVVLVGLNGFNDYLSIVGTAPNPDRGYLSATIFDCQTDLATGGPLGGDVSLSTKPNLVGGEGVTGFHFRPPVPPGTPTATTETPTSDGSGPIGFLNVPPGQYEISAISGSLGASVSGRSIVVSKGVFSTVLMLPRSK